MFDEAEFGADADEAALVARIDELETLKASAAAAQARATAALAQRRMVAEAERGVPVARRGRGLAAEVALARRDSPARGNQHLGFAKALVHEMPQTLAALERGALSEWRATLIVRESACLDVEDRAVLDAEMCGDPDALVGLGDRQIIAEAKAIAYRLNPHAVVDRAARAAQDRTVTVRPAPDTMTYLTALLPVAQGVSVYAALKRVADGCGDGRSRGQVMADTLVERVTGQAAEVAASVAVNLVLSDDTLSGGSGAATISDYGPVPAQVARRLVAQALADPEASATLRRLYARPDSGALVAMESRARTFPKGLARFIRTRDQRCRTPYCDAPIRHTDHVTPAARGGPTSGANGQGLCEACNYAKESAGWDVAVSMGVQGRHTTEITTPTGARHRSTAPPVLPGRPKAPISELEQHVGTVLCGVHAA
ncbi:HNH endonuclease [[Mycobacterium] wendilense]|uniref:DUF222 domain-containing protein n=1 Tax=[Mycobacterium] wendilense TaxID=3064284 RepID=A0ABM9MCT8_9MYCO|nr:DUF222 domain-containing protein [Mycolicibacterium sp. MU0050]CAJ1582086.1 DUF222 domain-containing protein [Mycolicibacterium sp. MU0050]